MGLSDTEVWTVKNGWKVQFLWVFFRFISFSWLAGKLTHRSMLIFFICCSSNSSAYRDKTCMSGKILVLQRLRLDSVWYTEFCFLIIFEDIFQPVLFILVEIEILWIDSVYIELLTCQIWRTLEKPFWLCGWKKMEMCFVFWHPGFLQ